MPSAVTIVILNWNGKKFLEKFLPSVLSTTYPHVTYMVVDNGSTDDSVDYLKSWFPQVEVLELDQNYGFTTGNNKALPHIKTPYYVLLNSDIEVEPNWLEPLVAMMDADEKIASIQPKLRAYHKKDHFEYAGAAGGYMDYMGYPYCRGRIFDVAEKDEGQYNEAGEVFWATGACSLIRKSVTDQIGLFEDRYFAHMEEIDFCWRAKNFGYKVMYCPDSIVYHVGGGTLNKTNPRKTFLNARNSLATLLKNFPARQVWYKFFFRLCLDGVWAFRSLLKGEFKTIWAIFKAHIAIYISLPYWIRRRREIYRDLKRIPAPTSGYNPISIVWQHFIKKKKKFSDLP